MTTDIDLQSLDALLDNAGLTQVEFARLLGVSRPSVNLWVNCRKKPSRRNTSRLSVMLPFLRDYARSGSTLHGLRGSVREKALTAMARGLRALFNRR